LSSVNWLTRRYVAASLAFIRLALFFLAILTPPFIKKAFPESDRIPVAETTLRQPSDEAQDNAFAG